MGTDLDSRPGTASTRHGRWTPLALGLSGLLAIPVLGRGLRLLWAAFDAEPGSGGPSPNQIAVVAAILLGGAGLVVGVRALLRHDRSWPVWLGTVLSGLVALGWLAFALGEVISPH
jgi:protein-S-isoprenylcysteine O-methyltransferase Ste14